MDLLNVITTLSHEFGTRDYVRGGGGNTSAKNADTLWVKPSGTELAQITPEKFVALDRVKLNALYDAPLPAEPHAREAVIKDLMAAAVKPGQTGRASVEAPLHDLLSGTFVVHNHAAIVNGLTCARNAAAVVRQLFPEALWVPYIDPGFTLCLDVRRRVHDFRAQRGHEPTLILLENHGIFVNGDSADDIRATYRRVFDALRTEYHRVHVSTELRRTHAPHSAEAVQVKQQIHELLGAAAAFIAGGVAFDVANGPISPDHIVYAKSFYYEGPLTRDGIAAFQRRHGYLPCVFVTPAGVFGAGASQKKAELALELAEDGALLKQLTAAFGGLQLLNDTQRSFIENWEVESYRQQQMT